MTLPRKLPKPKKRDNRIRSPGHLKWVREHACCSCGSMQQIEAAHVHDGTDGGTSMKPSDTWAISLCAVCHKFQHAVGEPAFERRTGINMKALAQEFAAASPALRRLGSRRA